MTKKYFRSIFFIYICKYLKCENFLIKINNQLKINKQ